MRCRTGAIEVDALLLQEAVGNEMGLVHTGGLQLQHPAGAYCSVAGGQLDQLEGVVDDESVKLAVHCSHPQFALVGGKDFSKGAWNSGGVLHKVECCVHVLQLLLDVQHMGCSQVQWCGQKV